MHIILKKKIPALIFTELLYHSQFIPTWYIAGNKHLSKDFTIIQKKS